MRWSDYSRTNSDENDGDDVTRVRKSFTLSAALVRNGIGGKEKCTRDSRSFTFKFKRFNTRAEWQLYIERFAICNADWLHLPLVRSWQRKYSPHRTTKWKHSCISAKCSRKSCFFLLLARIIYVFFFFFFKLFLVSMECSLASAENDEQSKIISLRYGPKYLLKSNAKNAINERKACGSAAMSWRHWKCCS